MEPGFRKIIRALVVDDSPVMCKAIIDILNSDSQIIVAGVAHNGKEAVELVPKLKPCIITMDIHMPVMDGLEATKQIMAYNPTPILVMSTSVFETGTNKAFKALSYGALDVVEKGKIDIIGDKKCGRELIERIKFLSKIKVIHHPLARLERKPEGKKEAVVKVFQKEALDRIVAIVASTGGPLALLEILKSLPREIPCGIVIVQHITEEFVKGLADWLNNECEIEVKIAKNLEEIRHGVAYIAPSNFQMRAREDNKIRLTDEPPYNGHWPSGDVLLESVADIYKERAIGVILTGMGNDGARGIRAIKQMRGKTIAQDEKTSVIFSMPNSAIELGAIDTVLPLENVAGGILRMLKIHPLCHV